MEKNTGEDIIKVQMFGQFEVENSQGILNEKQICSEMTTKLLVYFFCHHKNNISVQELSEAFLDDKDSDNPVETLKNLMDHVRETLKKTWGEQDYILEGNGTYYWNPAIEIWTDIDEFDRCIRQAKITKDEEEKIQEYMKAGNLYKGHIVPSLQTESWVTSLDIHYQMQYLDSAKEAAKLLEEKKRYEEMGNVCSKAIWHDALDEELNALFIRALIGQNKQKLAVQHYFQTINLLYDSLGVRPSKELEQVYEDLIKEQNKQEMDMVQIQTDLLGEEEIQGAFLIEYEFFKKAYQLEVRNTSRLGYAVYLALVTLYPTENVDKESKDYEKVLKEGMECMHHALFHSLRTGDIVSQYSDSQYIVMLPACQYENAHKVMERIQSNFYGQEKKLKIRVQYSLDEIRLGKTTRKE